MMLTQKHKKWLSLAFWVGVTLLLGALGGLIGNVGSYAVLAKPPLSPPAWLFPVVWSILYVLMGVAVWLVTETKEPDAQTAVKWYVEQLIVNILWPFIFFRLEWRLFAFFWLLLLIVLVSLTITGFRRYSKVAAWLLAPYMVWLLFAGYLNLGVYLLNG